MFGFPGAPPDVPEESQNLGLQDFHSSLDWVQENIEKFGGDPTRVTRMLLLSPRVIPGR